MCPSYASEKLLLPVSPIREFASGRLYTRVNTKIFERTGEKLRIREWEKAKEEEEEDGEESCKESSSLLINTDLRQYHGRISGEEGKHGTSRVGKELER